jgi:hypothetical protein
VTRLDWAKWLEARFEGEGESFESGEMNWLVLESVRR